MAMASQKLRYADFWDSINVDAVEEALGWVPEYTHNDNDVGYCIFPENHSHGDTTGKFAIHREKRIKHWPRAWKINLIEAENPH